VNGQKIVDLKAKKKSPPW